MDDNSAGSIEKSSGCDSHLTNSLRVAWPRGFPLSLCPGSETIFWSAEEGYHMLRKTHATLGVHSFHAGPEGNLISTELWVSARPWCARYPCQTLPWALFSTPLRMQYIRWKNFRQEIQCLSCHALSSASKLFATFVLSQLQWNTQQFKLCWILVYIKGCNILPHSENTFAGNNPIKFHFRGTFYCYLLFPCVQNPLISFFLPSKMMSGFIKKDFMKPSWGRGTQTLLKQLINMCNVLAVILKLHRWRIWWRETLTVNAVCHDERERE